MSRKAAPIRSVAFVSLGCPKNTVDSERMLGLLAEDGLVISSDHTQADAIVINTCGFLQASRDESLAEIRAAVQQKDTGRCRRVVVAGCLVQRYKTDLLADVPGIDRLVGVFDREHIVQAVRGGGRAGSKEHHFLGKYHDLSKRLAAAGGIEGQTRQTRTSRLPVFEDDRGRLRLTPRHYAFLRISEGCNQGCTFCTIPSIRGPMRSKPPEHILAEARELAADGAVELNLIGQDTTSYGTDIGYAAGLAGLLRTLDRELKDVAWLRLMYAYPSCFTDEMIDALAECARVVKYIDMPLQHINDDILLRMKRRVTRAQTLALLEKLRRRVPGIAIRTTFIAGSPGETEAQHRELVEFVRDFGFDMMGVFPYSQESSTPMGKLDDQLDDATKQSRVEELMLVQQEVAFARAKRMVGQRLEVLVDRPAGRDAADGWVARSAWQAPDIDSVTLVEHRPGRRIHVGQMLAVEVTDWQKYDLVARPAEKKGRSLQVIG